MKTLMRNGRDRRSENPSLGHARKERVSLFGTDQRITSGPAARRPHSKAEYMTAPERFADSQIPLAPRAPSIHDPKVFRSGRNFSAWIGLVPKQHSSGGKDRLGSISKQGDRYLRGLFVAGALAVIRYAKIHGTKHRPWLTALLARRPTKIAAMPIRSREWSGP